MPPPVQTRNVGDGTFKGGGGRAQSSVSGHRNSYPTLPYSYERDSRCMQVATQPSTLLLRRFGSRGTPYVDIKLTHHTPARPIAAATAQGAWNNVPLRACAVETASTASSVDATIGLVSVCTRSCPRPWWPPPLSLCVLQLLSSPCGHVPVGMSLWACPCGHVPVGVLWIHNIHHITPCSCCQRRHVPTKSWRRMIEQTFVNVRRVISAPTSFS